MKRSKLCFGVLSVLATIFGLSLSVFSSDSSALKYAYQAFPLYSSNYYVGDTSNHFSNYSGFSSRWLAGTRLDTTDLINDSTYHTFSQSGDCQPLSSSSTIFSHQYVNQYRYDFIGSGNNNFFQRSFNVSPIGTNNNLCIYSRNMHDFKFDSLYPASYNLSTGEATNLVPLNEQFFLTDALVNGGLKSLSVTLPINYERIGLIEAGTPLEWDFGIVTKSSSTLGVVEPSYNFTVSYFGGDPQDYNSDASFASTWTTDTGTCTIDTNYSFQTVSPNDRVTSDFSGLGFHCSYTPSSDASYFSALLDLYGGSQSYNPTTFFTYNTDGIYFTGSYLITDHDDTWSGQFANYDPEGTDVTDSPGYSYLFGSDSVCIEGDWFCNISNLFNFNLINPFAPIFSLFSNNESCASIPTLASMLHSEETQVCPWFSSDVRNIVTPVLGLSSMMLVFGFVVRWLGSSSGNFFEDSKKEEVSNQGGQWGHFKKAGK